MNLTRDRSPDVPRRMPNQENEDYNDPSSSNIEGMQSDNPIQTSDNTKPISESDGVRTNYTSASRRQRLTVALGVLAAVLALYGAYEIGQSSEPSEENQEQVVNDAEPELSSENSNESIEEMDINSVLTVPAELTRFSPQAEEYIHTIIRNNLPENRGSTEMGERQRWMWRGAVVKEVVVGVGDREQTAWLRMDHPFEVTLGNKVYWAAPHDESGALITLAFGETDDQVTIEVLDSYWDMEMRPFRGYPNSGQYVGAKPKTYSRSGLNLVDAFEQTRRGGQDRVSSTANFYSNREDALWGLDEPLYFGRDNEQILADYREAEREHEQEEKERQEQGN